MNNIDTKLYELFAEKTLSEGCNIWWNAIYKIDMPYYVIDWDFNKEFDGKILWYEPQLHDVFRVARNKWWKCEILDAETIGYKDIVVMNWVWINYNPTLSLMNQADSTKQAIVELFANS